MGRPEQTGTGAIVAVIVVGMLLLLVVVGGAAVLLGGLFWVSYESAPQQVMTSPQAVTSADVFVPDVLLRIEIDGAGEIAYAGEIVTPERLRERLQGLQQNHGYVTPQLSADADCPDDVSAEVISICEEVLGTSPEIVVGPMTEPAAPPQPVVLDESE